MLGYKGPPQPSPALGDASMRVIVMSRSDALAATHIKPSRWISCEGRRQRRSTNSNATCAAKIALRFDAILTSAAINSRRGAFRTNVFDPPEKRAS
jgi:hypothetical protein